MEPIGDPAERRWIDELNEYGRSRLPGLIGMRVLRANPGLVTAQVRITPALMTGPRFAFGAVAITLADLICGYGVNNHIPPGWSFTTVELKVNFVGTAGPGDTIEGTATPVHLGRTTQVWDAVVSNPSNDGRTIALFRCTQLLLGPRTTRLAPAAER